MFRGRFEIAIDGKGRVNIPSRLRETLRERFDERLVITNDFDNCLVAYPYNEWMELEKKASNLSMASKQAKAFQRFFMSAAVECPLDKQGRVLVPPVLREYAGLDKDIVIVGMQNKIEIWSRSSWDEELKMSKESCQESFEDMAEVLADLGI